MGKSFWIILGVIILATIGLVLFAGPSDETTNTAENADILAVTDIDHKRGLASSSVSLIEYADFQCSACALIFPVVEQMFREFGDQVEFVARNFPLISIHPNSMSAHRAAEAASAQDSFWEMHDLLYQKQQAWSESTNATGIFEGYAAELGLDLNKYKADVVSQKAFDHINDDANGGNQVGVQGTPTFFLNGEQIPTPQSIEAFRAVLQAAVDEVTDTAKAQ